MRRWAAAGAPDVAAANKGTMPIGSIRAKSAMKTLIANSAGLIAPPCPAYRLARPGGAAPASIAGRVQGSRGSRREHARPPPDLRARPAGPQNGRDDDRAA